MGGAQEEVAAALAAHTAGDAHALDRLVPLLYSELRAIADRLLRRESRCQSLQPTALVHEAYLRLVSVTRIDWRGRTHFLAFAATQMRRVLVDRARARGRNKRGQGALHVSLDERDALSPGLSLDLLALDEALERLEHRNQRQARVAEMRLLAGMTMEEIASALEVSERTTHQDWSVARAWLSQWLGGAESGRRA